MMRVTLNFREIVFHGQGFTLLPQTGVRFRNK